MSSAVRCQHSSISRRPFAAGSAVPASHQAASVVHYNFWQEEVIHGVCCWSDRKLRLRLFKILCHYMGSVLSLKCAVDIDLGCGAKRLQKLGEYSLVRIPLSYL